MLLIISPPLLNLSIGNLAQKSQQTPIYFSPLPTFSRDLIGQKRRARSIWQWVHLPSDKRIYNKLVRLG